MIYWIPFVCQTICVLTSCFVFKVMFHPVENSEVSIIYPHFADDENLSRGGETPCPFLLGTVLGHICCPRIIINKPLFHSQKFGTQIIWSLCARMTVWGWVEAFLSSSARVVGRNFLGTVFCIPFLPCNRLYFSVSKSRDRERERDSLLICWALPGELLARSVHLRIKVKKWSFRRKEPFGYTYVGFIHMFRSLIHWLTVGYL